MSGGQGHFSGLEAGHRKCMSEKTPHMSLMIRVLWLSCLYLLRSHGARNRSPGKSMRQSPCLVFNKMPGSDSNAMRIMKTEMSGPLRKKREVSWMAEQEKF